MDKILEIYNEYHFLVLIFVIIFFVIYINSIQKKENITILQNEVTKTNATVEQKENIKVDINEAENENLKDLSNEIVDTKIDIESYVKIKYLLTNEELLIQIVNKSSINQRDNDGIKYINLNSPLALALINKTIGDIVKFKIDNSKENYLYVEVLDIPNSINENINEEINEELTNPREFRYTSTRLSFRRNYIEQMSYNDILFIEVVGAQNPNNNGVFRLTKEDINNTFANVINSVAYQRDGNYNYPNNPPQANQYRVYNQL